MKILKKHSDIIVLSILWIVSAYSVAIVFIDSYQIGIQNYIGYALLILLTILRFYKFKKFRTVLGIFLIIGSINAIQFTFFRQIWSFSFSIAGQKFPFLGFQPFSILLLIFFLIINFSDFMSLIYELFSEDPNVSKARKNKIFENNYENLLNVKDAEIQDIIENRNKYANEYVKAAERIKYERTNN